MNERVRELHRKIAACRDLLARGPAASEAMHYLRQIMEAEAELERTRAETHKVHQTIAATRQTEARKFLASLS